jgi:hypothetical protein
MLRIKIEININKLILEYNKFGYKQFWESEISKKEDKIKYKFVIKEK